jgi:chemotaxis protein CheC
MSEEVNLLKDGEFLSQLQVLANMGAVNAADGLGAMTHRHVRMTIPSVSIVPLSELPRRMGGPETEVVGIYLVTMGDLPGHIMLVLGHEDALRLVDMLLEQPEGTATELDPLGRSALAEVGNLTASFFLNMVASITGLKVRPSPPAVMVDMLGAILDIILAAVGASADEVILLDTLFQEEEGDRRVQMHFWVVPDLNPLQMALKRSLALS